jgi:hypothetical protein
VKSSSWQDQTGLDVFSRLRESLGLICMQIRVRGTLLALVYDFLISRIGSSERSNVSIDLTVVMQKSLSRAYLHVPYHASFSTAPRSVMIIIMIVNIITKPNLRFYPFEDQPPTASNIVTLRDLRPLSVLSLHTLCANATLTFQRTAAIMHPSATRPGSNHHSIPYRLPRLA